MKISWYDGHKAYMSYGEKKSTRRTLKWWAKNVWIWAGLIFAFHNEWTEYKRITIMYLSIAHRKLIMIKINYDTSKYTEICIKKKEKINVNVCSQMSGLPLFCVRSSGKIHWKTRSSCFHDFLRVHGLILQRNGLSRLFFRSAVAQRLFTAKLRNVTTCRDIADLIYGNAI